MTARHAGGMQLSEHEMTVALRGAALTVAGARRGRRKAANAWESLTRYEQYTLLTSVGDQVLPVLHALPDVPVPPGERPSCSIQQIEATVAGLVDPTLGRLKRAVVVKTRTALVRAALDSLPPRLDLEAFKASED